MNHIFHKVGEFAKAHPWETGGLVFVAGVSLFLLTRGSSSGSGSVNITDTGAAPPTDAQVQANAAVQIAQINAGAAVAGSGNSLQLQNIAASVQSNQDNDALTLGLASLDVQKALGLANITAQSAIQTSSINAQTTIATNQTGTTQNIIEAVIKAQTPVNPGPTFAQTIAGDPTAAITQEYHSALGRDPDPAGLAYWTGIVAQEANAGLSPATIAANIQSSFNSSPEKAAIH